MDMRDIRLLTLYKQHYLDHYIKPLQSQITCLGYYDGLDIEVIEDNNASPQTQVIFLFLLYGMLLGKK